MRHPRDHNAPAHVRWLLAHDHIPDNNRLWHDHFGARRLTHQGLAPRAEALLHRHARRVGRAPHALVRAGARATVRDLVALRVHRTGLGLWDPVAAPDLELVERPLQVAGHARHGRAAEAARRLSRAVVAAVHGDPEVHVRWRRERRAVDRRLRVIADPRLGLRRRRRHLNPSKTPHRDETHAHCACAGQAAPLGPFTCFTCLKTCSRHFPTLFFVFLFSCFCFLFLFSFLSKIYTTTRSETEEAG